MNKGTLICHPKKRGEFYVNLHKQIQ